MRLLNAAAILTLPLVTLAGCSSSDETASSTPATASSTSTTSAPTSASSLSAAPSTTASSQSPTSNTTTTSTTQSTSTTSPLSPSSTTSSRSTKPTAAKTADCTNLGTGKHYPCTQAEYDAINEADEASGPTPTPTTTSAPAHGVTSVRSCYEAPSVRPTLILIACGDGGEGVSDIRWTSWGAQGALGRGTHFERVCEPNCAEGHDVTTPVSVRLSAPLKSSRGTVFSVMTVTGQRVHTVQLVTND